MCPHRIDTAQALRLIGSHGDCINRLRRLTFNPGNTSFFDWLCSCGLPNLPSSNPSTLPDILLLVPCLWYNMENRKGQSTIGHTLFPSFSGSSFILYTLFCPKSCPDKRKQEMSSCRQTQEKIFFLRTTPHLCQWNSLAYSALCNIITAREKKKKH